MNNGTFSINEGKQIQILIGSRGESVYTSDSQFSNSNGGAGGITSFGSYLYATGDEGGYTASHTGNGGSEGGTYSGRGGIGYQFGGGGEAYGPGGDNKNTPTYDSGGCYGKKWCIQSMHYSVF